MVDFIIGAIVVGAVAAIIGKRIWNIRQGKSGGCGCGCGCSGCGKKSKC